MVGGFFSLLIGYFVFLIMTYREGNKVWKQEANNRNKNKQYAIEHNRPDKYQSSNAISRG